MITIPTENTMESVSVNSAESINDVSNSAGADRPKQFVSQSIFQISDIVATLVLQRQWKFILGDDDVEATDIGDPRSLLGPVLWQAEKKYRLVYSGDVREAKDGASLGVKFVVDEACAVGSRPVIETEAGSPRSSAIIFLYDVLSETFENNRVHRDTASLDALVQEFRADNEAGLIPWVVESAVKTPEAPAPN